jgi:uncharacterized RDD family membrane protein YckC
MQTIRVHTTQNVYIHYPLASVGDRIIAHLIDSVLLIIYAVAVIALFYRLDLDHWSIWTLAGMPFLFYSLIFEIFMNGQSPGKYLMKIKVVRLDGAPPKIGDYVLRWLMRAIDLRLFSGAVAMVSIIAGGKGQRLGDVAAGTSVIKLAEQKEITSQEIFIMTESEYQPVFHEAKNLSARDIEIIHQVLEVNKNTGNVKPAVLLTEKIKGMLDLQTDLPPVKFLYTIIKDYQHLTAQQM